MTAREILAVSLGPDDGGLVTLSALAAMEKAERLVLRTGRHGAAALLESRGIAYETLDDLYESSPDFEALTEAACRRILALAEAGDVCYAVSDPAADQTVQLLARSLPEGVTLRVLPGVSLAESAACAALSAGYGAEDLRRLPASSLGEARYDPAMTTIITELNDARMAADVKLWLCEWLSDEAIVGFLVNAAAPAQGMVQIPLYALDRQQAYDHRSAVFVPAGAKRAAYGFEDAMAAARIRRREARPKPEEARQKISCAIRERAKAAADAVAGNAPGAEEILGALLLALADAAADGEAHRAFTALDVTTAAAEPQA